MKTINTKIPDTNFVQFNDTFKVLLMDQLVGHFLPLFREEVEKKKKILVSHTHDYTKLKEEVSKTKEKLVKLNAGMRNAKFVRDILDEISRLYNHDILYGENKKIVLDIIDSINSLGTEVLLQKLKVLRGLAYQNIKQVQIRN